MKRIYSFLFLVFFSLSFQSIHAFTCSGLLVNDSNSTIKFPKPYNKALMLDLRDKDFIAQTYKNRVFLKSKSKVPEKKYRPFLDILTDISNSYSFYIRNLEDIALNHFNPDNPAIYNGFQIVINHIRKYNAELKDTLKAFKGQKSKSQLVDFRKDKLSSSQEPYNPNYVFHRRIYSYFAGIVRGFGTQLYLASFVPDLKGIEVPYTELVSDRVYSDYINTHFPVSRGRVMGKYDLDMDLVLEKDNHQVWIEVKNKTTAEPPINGFVGENWKTVNNSMNKLSELRKMALQEDPTRKITILTVIYFVKPAEIKLLNQYNKAAPEGITIVDGSYITGKLPDYLRKYHYKTSGFDELTFQNQTLDLNSFLFRLTNFTQ